eukprot:m51a1_g2686 putative amp-dependent synthetase and ligase (188) ;mRNA; f:752332-753018
MLQDLRIEGVGVEIGVLRGDFSNHCLSKWSLCTSWYAVDPWVYQSTYDDGANADNTTQETRYKKVVKMLSKYGPKAHVLRMFSSDAAKQFQNESVDFVYIDARHDYSSVIEDMTIWWPKLKQGGVMAGHDYLNLDELDTNWKTQPNGTVDVLGRAVRAAVEDFTRSIDRQPLVSYREVKWNSWYFAK